MSVIHEDMATADLMAMQCFRLAYIALPGSHQVARSLDRAKMLYLLTARPAISGLC
jgi:hypothetical protein